MVGRRRISEAEQAAWWADLDRWVATIHASYVHLWPDPPEGRAPYARTRKRPWPACWREHAGLVEDLVALKVWQEGLLDGMEWAGGPRGWCEWRSFVDTLAVQVQSIAQHCAFRHQEQQRGAMHHGGPGDGVPTWQGNGRAESDLGTRERRGSSERNQRAEATVDH